MAAGDDSLELVCECSACGSQEFHLASADFLVSGGAVKCARCDQRHPSHWAYAVTSLSEEREKRSVAKNKGASK